MDDIKPHKTYKEICDIITYAQQCVSPEIDVEVYLKKEKIINVMKVINVQSWILTRQEMLMDDVKDVSSIIFCHEYISCLFINNDLNYIMYHSSHNKKPSPLIERFISIYYPKHNLINILTDVNRRITDWISCLLFLSVVKMSQKSSMDELLDTVKRQFQDIELTSMFMEFCEIVSSEQQQVSKFDLTRPKHIDQSIKNIDNLNRVIDIMYDIVCWCCETMKEDEKLRNNKLYCNIKESERFQKLTKHIQTSLKIVSKNIVKTWNKFDYELSLMNNNIEVVKKYLENIMFCMLIHYKYVISLFIELLQIPNDKDIIYKYSFVIISLTEEYDEKIRKIIQLADGMKELLNTVWIVSK